MAENNENNMELIAEVTVRRFFTHYLEQVFPQQLVEMITAHNQDVTAHSQQIRVAIKAETSRLKLWLIGLIFVGGLGGGVGIARAVTFIVGS